jgi:diguanylate cyclase (GGDEF)-like protein
VGGRSVLLGLAYSTVLGAVSALHASLVVSIVFATAAYLAVSLLLWRLPAILAEDGPVTSHYIPRRLALVYLLNAVIPMVTHYGEPQAWVFILADPFRMKLIMDLTVTTAVFSVIALTLFGYDARHRLDGLVRTAKALPWPDDPDPLQQMKEFAAATLRVDRLEIRATPPRSRFEIGTPFRTHSGETRYLVARRNPGRSPLLDRDQQALDAIAHIGQETMRVRGEAHDLRTEANTDPLTRLFNYRGFQAAIDDVNSRRAEQGGIAVVYIDLDGFKAVNDRYGHEVGNQLLKEVAHRLQEAVRPRDTVARVGGDEFVVLLRDIKDRGHAEQVAHRIVATASSPVLLGGHLLPVRLSEGVTFSNDAHESLGSLVNEADARMYAKRGRSLAGGETASVSAPAESRPSGRRAAIADLITGRRLDVAYQPIVDGVRGTIVAVEALVRATDPLLGPVDPSLLVHEAKRQNLLDQLTEQVLEQTFADMHRMQRIAPALRDVHVNLDLGQLAHGPTQERLGRLAAAHPDVRLTVEMTEDSLNLASEETLAKLEELRSQGIRLALDDFGQGYSTMLAVVEVPFDALKVDRSLIASVAASAKSGQVIRSLARLCRNLHVAMIVEGVEHPEERDILLKLGARYMQGFLFARPESADALCERFSAHGLTIA